MATTLVEHRFKCLEGVASQDGVDKVHSSEPHLRAIAKPGGHLIELRRLETKGVVES